MLSATMSWLCFFRSSASSSFFLSASSVSSAIASFSATVARARLSVMRVSQMEDAYRRTVARSEMRDPLWDEYWSELDIWLLVFRLGFCFVFAGLEDEKD